jgi:hypothetical protein
VTVWVKNRSSNISTSGEWLAEFIVAAIHPARRTIAGQRRVSPEPRQVGIPHRRGEQRVFVVGRGDQFADEIHSARKADLR